MARKKPAKALSPAALELVAARFRALGDPSRLRILNFLMTRPASVQGLEAGTGLTQTNVSRHLGLLRREGVVSRTPQGNRAIYAISDPTIHALCELVCGALAERSASDLDAFERDGAGI